MRGARMLLLFLFLLMFQLILATGLAGFAQTDGSPNRSHNASKQVFAGSHSTIRGETEALRVFLIFCHQP
jgi:hypothetical protein